MTFTVKKNDFLKNTALEDKKQHSFAKITKALPRLKFAAARLVYSRAWRPVSLHLSLIPSV